MRRPKYVRRGLVVELLAISRCASEEAREALRANFARHLEIARRGGVKAAVTIKQQKLEDVGGSCE